MITEVTDSYYNMKEKIRPHMELIENAKAVAKAGNDPKKLKKVKRKKRRKGSSRGTRARSTS